jgi:hypothetical protein
VFKGCASEPVSTFAGMTRGDGVGRRFAEIIITP